MTSSFDKAAAVPLGAPLVDACLGGGLRKAVLHEVFARDAAGAGAASGFALGLAGRVSGKRRFLWVRQDFAAQDYGALWPPGLVELGLDPERVILVKAPDATAALRVAQDGLACGGLGAVIAEIYGAPKILDLTASRRLALAAARTAVTGFLLRHPAPLLPSAAETRWIVAPARSAPAEGWGRPMLDVALARNRHGLTGQFSLEWRDGLFHDATAHSCLVVSAPADGPPAAPDGRALRRASGAGGEKRQRAASDGARWEGRAARP